MDCERFQLLLDAYIDGALNDEELREFMNHAQACENCREELRAAEALRDMLKDMDEDVAVPLQAQAAWRNAVRAESKKLRTRRFMRIAYGAAAALVVVFGCTFALNGLNAKNETAAPEMLVNTRMAVTDEMLIASDGDAAAAAGAEANISYTARKKIETADYDEACKTIEQLCSEYKGVFSAEPAETDDAKRAVRYRIELPYEYMPDFMNAAGHIGTELASEINGTEQETAVIVIQLNEK